MNYTIRYINPSRQYITIEAEFDATNSTALTLQFPAWRPGRYELADFAKNIKNLTIVNENNEKVAHNKLTKDTWLVDCKNVDHIKVSYAYYANQLNAGSSFIDDTQLYVNPVNCLIYIKERQLEPCEVRVEIPSNFEIACGAKHENNTIYCNDYHELVDSPFIASASMQHKTYTVLNRTFHLWFQGEVGLDWDKIITDFKKFTLTQIEKFSDRPAKFVGFPKKDYHFIFQISLNKAYHGVEHTTSTMIALGPANKLMTELYDDFLGVSSHELYHYWNIKSIRPTEMYPYDYSQENFSKLGYVAEGVTTYLGDVFLALSQVKPFSWYKLEFEKLLKKHFENFGRFNYSVAESSWDTWLDGYVKGAPQRKVSIYNEGALLAFITDMKIRVASENKESIHSVMYYLYTEFAQKGKGYTEDDYKAACEKFSGVSFDLFFKNFVHGTFPYESILVEALEAIGFQLEMEENEAHAERILGIKTAGNKCVITDIYPGSSAELGGMMLGDQIISINKSPIANDINKTLAPFHDIPLEMEVNRMGRILSLICPNTNRAMYPVYKIKKMEIPSSLNKRIFKSWIGYKWEDCE